MTFKYKIVSHLEDANKLGKDGWKLHTFSVDGPYTNYIMELALVED